MDGGMDDIPPLMRSPHRLKLASFCWNVRRGATPTTAEGSIERLDWAQQLEIARLSEDAGLDAIIPLGRWRGFDGDSGFWDESYETIAWAAALASVTKAVTIFSTVHVPLLHPVRAAKLAATIDHVSGGRFGYNIVAGWNEAEFRMFGKRQRPHDERYAESAEWVDLVRRLWSESGPFDWHGDYYTAEGAISAPRPLAAQPVLMSAGASPAGCAFAAAHADVIFISAADLESVRTACADVKRQAHALGRDIQVWTMGGMLCCDSEDEAARRYHEFVHEKGDWAAARIISAALTSGKCNSVPDHETRRMQERFIAWNYAYPLMGTARQITDKLVALTDAGLDGLALVWVDYEEGLTRLHRDVLPLARQAGLRVELN